MNQTNIKNKILSRAINSSAKICLPESQDPRIKDATKEMVNLGFNVISPDLLKGNIKNYYELISKKKFSTNWSEKMKLDFLDSNLNLCLTALDSGHIDCLVGGASHTTSDVLRSVIRIIGLKRNSKWVSSIFFMISPKNNECYTFADCGVIPDPNSEQLCEIAYNASNFHELLTEEKPRIAFLSFSTKGSASHYKVKKVQDGVEKFKNKYPNIIHEGEIQFDAAINQSISEIKIGKSKLNGKGNVFIFPDLDSANIAYKITQHLAGFQALGPLLQGINKPVHDLSRGCSVDDIINVSAIAIIQSIHA